MRDRVARLPSTPGVYRFRDADDRVLYIGRATSLRSRVASYWSDLRERSHLAPMVTDIARIEAVATGSAHEAAWLERNLLEAVLPPWNRTLGGQETVVYLRLDDRPAAPRLTVEHLVRPRDDARYFGPYLGGLRARQAARALGRIFPLSATGTRLRGAQLDIARARGVAGADRRVLIRRVVAVLARRPAAVAAARTALEQLRDQAAGTLAFELAARLQGEIQSLDWITSTQRVSIMDATDFEIYGWSGKRSWASAFAEAASAGGHSAAAARPRRHRTWPPRRSRGPGSPSARPSLPRPSPTSRDTRRRAAKRWLRLVSGGQ